MAEPVTRADRLAAARAAGRDGQDPPEWMTEADEVDAYEQGYANRGAVKTKPHRARAKGNTPAPSRSSGSGESEPAAQPSGWSPPPPSSRVISMPSEPAHDLAGVLVGIVAVAFLINVLHGTWKDWLKAKFLNQGGWPSTAAAPSATATPPAYPVLPGATPDFSFLNPGQTFTPTAPAAPSQGAP